MASSKEVKAGGAFLELGLRDKLDAGLRSARAKLNAFAAGAAAIGGALTAASTAVLAPLLASVFAFAAAGDTLDKMSLRTGVAASELSALGFAAEQTGASLQDIESGTAGLGTFLKQLEQGSTRALKPLQILGLTQADLANKSTTDRLALLGERLKGIADVDLRQGLARQLFGGTQLLPLLLSGADGIRELTAEAERLGIVIGDDQAKQAAEFTDAWNRIKRSLGAVAIQAGAALAPVLTDLLGQVLPLITGAVEWTKANKGLILTIAKVAAGVGIAGGVLLGTALAAKLLAISLGVVSGVLAVIGGVVAFVLSPIGLVIAAVVGLGAAFVRFTSAGQAAAGTVAGAFGELGRIVGPAIEGIAAALSSGDLTLAAGIAMASLKLIFGKGMAAISGLMTGTLGDTVATISTQILQGDLAGAWTTAVEALSFVWSAFVEGLFSVFNDAIKRIIGVWEAATKAISNKITELGLFNEQQIGEQSKRLDRQRVESLQRSIAAARESATSAASPEEAAAQLKLAEDLAGSLSKLESTLGRDALDEIKATANSILGDQATALRDATDQVFDVDAARKRTDEAFETLRKSTAGGSAALDAELVRAQAELDALIAAAKAGAAAREEVPDLPDVDEIGETITGAIAGASTGTFSGFAAAFLSQGGGPQDRIAKASEATADHTKAMRDKLAAAEELVLG